MEGKPHARHRHRELVAAMFASEFVDGEIDPETLRRVHAGEHDEWLTALDRSGMVGKEVLADLAEVWRGDPRELLEALLAEADEVARRRCLTAWARLDHAAHRPAQTRIG
ncbi:hypothetical protein [Nocardia sp. CNY236]|uniref:hypothetical protein n=1 Tax=Nocardia sp. CNY236 TaxID=1169152 RepID=UPI000685C153|nr:hypothetical protein [Nocardia sp. CNY236]